MSKFWHWPDRIIGKRESRQLREEHNALANSHAELLEALTAIYDRHNAETMAQARAAIAKATT